MSKKYVKIWEQFHGKKLPENKEIHHIDGNRNNNDVSNLLDVTIEEHLKIHMRQNDYGAVCAILMRMDENNRKNISKFSSMQQKKLYSEGKHNFQKISKERHSEISRNAGLDTVKKKIGIHAINSVPELAKENGKRARSKLSREKELEMMKNWREKIKGSKWWNDGEKNVRSKQKPGENFKEGMLK